MKKSVSIVTAAFFIMALGSCKKEYNCKCSYTLGGKTSTTTFSIGKQKKKDAAAECKAKQSAYVGYATICTLN